MKELLQNLADIAEWLEQAPPSSLSTDEELVCFLVEEIMSRTAYLLRVGASLAPDQDTASRGYTKHRAIIVGHFVRLAKLYDGFCGHAAERKLELAGVFMRPILETEARLSYFITCRRKKEVLRSYVLTSYRAERQSLLDLNAKRQKRRLLPIEQRMRRSMMRHLREDGITFKELKATKSWKIGGKDLRAMLREMGREWEYSYGFGGSSRWVHGGWLELKHYHLVREGRFYSPYVGFADPDPRIVGSITVLVLETLLRYLQWLGSDPDRVVIDNAERLRKLVISLDQEHERRLVADSRERAVNP